MTNYTIQVGDNLTKIAKANNTTVAELARINNISNPDKIQAGKTIKLFEEPAVAEQQTVTERQSQEELTQQLESMHAKLTQMQNQMNNQGEDFNNWEIFGLGLAGAATYKIAEKTLPYAWSGAKSAAKTTAKVAKQTGSVVANVAVDTGSKVASTAQNVGKKMAQGVKHVAKKIELEYAFGKDAVKHGAQKASEAVRTAGKKGSKIMGITKAGKALTKAAPVVTAVVTTAEIVNAYNKGGTEVAVKQGAKCASGLACAAAGAKLGALAGACTGPAAAVAVPVLTVVGSIAGYLGGEKLMGKLIDKTE